MKFAAQMWTELGNFANPRDKEPCITGSLKDIKAEFDQWRALHDRYYDLDQLVNGQICANVYRGDTIGEYPDFMLVLGPRGGIKKQRT